MRVYSSNDDSYDTLFLHGHGTVTLLITTLTALNNDYWVELNIIFLQFNIGDTVTRKHGTGDSYEPPKVLDKTCSTTIAAGPSSNSWLALLRGQAMDVD